MSVFYRFMPQALAERLPPPRPRRPSKRVWWPLLLFRRLVEVLRPKPRLSDEPFAPAAPARRPWLSRLLPRRLTPEEKAERANQQRQREAEMRLRNTLAREAARYARDIRDTYTRYGVCYRGSDEHGRYVQEVRFVTPYVGNEQVIKLKVDTRRLPRGIGKADLVNDDILRLLSYNCQHRVSYRDSAEGGLWLWIERETGIGGVPAHVSYDEMLAARPASSGSFAIPIGVTENKRAVWKNLIHLVNLIVAGSPGAGKSNYINALICTLIRFNDAQHMKLVLVDLKGGLEFKFYKGLPHLMRLPKIRLRPKRDRGLSRDEKAVIADLERGIEDGELADELAGAAEPAVEQVIARAVMDATVEFTEQYDVEQVAGEVDAVITDRRDVPGVIYSLIVEAERRMALIEAADGCKHLSEYNERNPHKFMPRIFVIIDEYADVKLDPGLGQRVEDMLVNLANRARAVGIHIIVCTQTPEKNVISARLRNAMVARMVFAMANQYVSQALVGDYSASGLAHQGRAIFRVGQQRYEVQTPYIPNELVVEHVAGAREGRRWQPPSREHDVTDQEILDWAMEFNGGNIGWREIYEQFRHRKYSMKAAQEFGKRMEGRRVVANEVACVVVPSSGMFANKTPRRLIPVQQADAMANGGSTGAVARRQ